MHANTSDGAAKALAGLRHDPNTGGMHVNTTGFNPGEQTLHYEHESALRENEARDNAALADVEDAALPQVVGLRTAKDHPCPDCGWPVINWWSGNNLDPGDVDPRADCTNPDCGWGY